MFRKGLKQGMYNSASRASLLVDINEATIRQLEQAGIAHGKAEAIIENRKRAGRFNGIGDLMRVTGIGQGFVERYRTLLVCRAVESSLSSTCPVTTTRRETRSTTMTAGKTTAKKSGLAVKSSSSTVISTTDPQPSTTLRSRIAAISEPTVVPSARKAVSSFGCNGPSFAGRHDVNQRSSTNSSAANVTGPLNNTRTANEADVLLEPSNGDCVSNESIPLALPTGGVENGCGAIALPNISDNAFGDSVLVGSQQDGDKMSDLPSDSIVTAASDGTAACCSDRDCKQLTVAIVNSHEKIEKQVVPENESACSIRHCELYEKHLMKRKADDPVSELGEITGCKKPYSAGVDCTTSHDDGHTSHLPGFVEATSPLSRKQRIPSRKNPPAMMPAWLQTFQEWSHAERLVALDALMEICDATQVRHVMQVIEPQFQRDFISLLPKELALYVLSFLEPKDLARASQTCHYWHILAEDNLLWREKCQEEGLSELHVFSRLSRRPDRRVGAACNSSSATQWKGVYKRQRQIENNWCRGTIKAPKVLKGHDEHVITCLEFCGNKIVSGSDDNTLKVWSAVTGKCLRTLVGHTGGVWSSQMQGHTVISGSTDRTLKVWNVDTGQCVYTLYGHTSTVRCMHLHGNRLVSGSRDATLRMWDIETGHCLHVLIGHVAAVRCVQYDGRRVVSGAYDYMVKIWDPETETCLQTLAGHTNRVYSLQFDGVHIVSGSLDTSIRVWSAETGACLHTLIGHQSLTSGMELRDNILVSGNADSTVKIWNIKLGQCLQTLQGTNKHQSAVTSLQFNRRFVITSSDDGTVKIWDLKNGEFLRNLVTLDSGGSGGVVWRIRCSNTKLVCAVGSRNGTEETKLLVLDFDVDEDESSTRD